MTADGVAAFQVDENQKPGSQRGAQNASEAQRADAGGGDVYGEGRYTKQVVFPPPQRLT